MQRLIGHFWFHDYGGGAYGIFEHVTNRFVRVTSDNEPLPERIAFETRQQIEAAIALKLQQVRTEHDELKKQKANPENVNALLGLLSSLTEEQKAELIKKLAPNYAPLPEKKAESHGRKEEAPHQESGEEKHDTTPPPTER